MIKLNSQQIKSIELDILKTFAAYCDKHGLSYYLAYGTLLGAIRHKGFIPWDDDIDLMMTRKDYEKLHELVKEDPIGDDYEFISFELGTFRAPFAKVLNKNALADTYGRGLEEKLWIDIFAIDNYEESISDINLKWYKAFIAMDTKNFEFTKKSIGKFIVKTLLFWKSKKTVVSQIRQRAIAVPYSGLLANMTWENVKHCYFTQEDINGFSWVTFEGHKFKTFVNPHKILENMYGDYMKLPSKDKRITHQINAFWTSEKPIP